MEEVEQLKVRLTEGGVPPIRWPKIIRCHGLTVTVRDRPRIYPLISLLTIDAESCRIQPALCEKNAVQIPEGTADVCS